MAKTMQPIIVVKPKHIEVLVGDSGTVRVYQDRVQVVPIAGGGPPVWVDLNSGAVKSN